jgi:phosphoribosylformimino-5-aminoimidazole carboxamide ribotide isomerase
VIVYPAIDILGGRAVRLVRGDFDRATSYAEDPLRAALAWTEAGAERLHVVDLDGARAGQPVNLEQVRRIAAQTGVPVQFGGGLRSLDAINDAVDAGAARIVIGTAAFTDLLDAALAEHAQRVVVSVDVRGGRVATKGWTETTALSALEAIGALRNRGVRQFVYTDIDRDGTLEGLGLDEIEGIATASAGELIYSGGVGSLADLEALARLPLAGVIVGKALYEERFTLEQAKAALCT